MEFQFDSDEQRRERGRRRRRRGRGEGFDIFRTRWLKLMGPKMIPVSWPVFHAIK